jgi:sialic acid synthase SpsE/sugar phosphate isomerase/epimerase
MIIDRKLSDYIINSQETLHKALNHIKNSKKNILMVVGFENYLEGIITLGDIVRWISEQEIADLKIPIINIVNKNYSKVTEENISDAEKLLLDYNFIPIIDNFTRIVGVIRKRKAIEGIEIESRVITESSPTFIIAEIGLNHNGDMEIAKKLIDEAVKAKVDSVKFQMRDMNSLYRNKGENISDGEDLGSQYIIDILKKTILSNNEYFELFDYCKKKGVIPICTPWDIQSLNILEGYGIAAYKIASADLTNHELLVKVAKTGKPIICSTGMSSEEEIKEATNLFCSLGAQFIMLHVNSTYPTPFKDINLNYLTRLRDICKSIVGYSGHERGFHIPLVAVGMGAKVIEKHITIDRNMEGNDHKVSLLPDEFSLMVSQIREIEESLGFASPRVISQGEVMNRVNLAKSIVSNVDIKKGEIITRDKIEIKSPGRGLQPNKLEALLNRISLRNIKKGDFFYQSDLNEIEFKPRNYKMQRRWGIPVRYHDFKTILSKSNPNLLEFHLSYKDLDLNLNDYFKESYNLELIVHSPDLFTGDHILNLASDDNAYRKRSIMELQRVVDLTLELNRFFESKRLPAIVASLGGFTRDSHVDENEKNKMYETIIDSLSQVNSKGVEILAQTLPPFPWYMGGQLYLNLFVKPEDSAEFCAKSGYNLCLDVCHTKMAAKYFNFSFEQSIELLGKYVKHLHIADAVGYDGEGLQIGEGEINFDSLSKQLDIYSPNASFIPEIWMGHKNDGEGFFIGLEKLEGLF